MTERILSPYLEDIPLSEALARWWAALEAAGLADPMPGERVSLADAIGRITAEPVWARISSPHYHASAMDGYAVRAEDTRGASETHPLCLAVGQQAFYVDTGDPLPPGTNAVIMVEDVQVHEGQMADSRWPIADGDRPSSAKGDRPSAIEILSAVPPGSTSGRWARIWSRPS